MPRIYLHVGVPKTGTTYLQGTLRHNRKLLAQAGVLYPAPYPEAHFDAVVDLRDMAFGGHDDAGVVGRWPRLAQTATRWQGHSVVLSHELLAGANESTIAEAMQSLTGHEVHVVLTARDLGRQVPAMWQEYVKNHSTVGFEAYAERLARTPVRGKAATVFWRQQDVVEVLRRWATAVPDQRLHLVTVPPPGSDPQLLWQRFTSALDLPAGEIELAPVPRNTSLGFAEAELLRRINRALGEELEWPAYEATIKSWFAEDLLAGLSGDEPPGVPEHLRPYFDSCASDMIDQLAAWGLPVEGDLADLQPRWPEAARSTVTDDLVLDAAVAALTRLLQQRAAQHWTGRGRQLVGRARRSPLVRRLPEPVQAWLKRLASS